MNGHKYVFDTNAIVYYLQNRPEWVNFIDGTPMTKRVASVVTRIELLSYPGLTANDEDRVRRFLAGLRVVPLDETIETAAIALRRAARLKLPDAVIAATALSLGATLITGDQRLRDLDWPGFRTVTPA